MALGNNYDNNRPKYKEIEVYSPYKMSNKEGFDPSFLSFSFWNQMLKITLAPILAEPTEQKVWDYENKCMMFLTHQKARVLDMIIQEVLDDKRENGGVTSGENGVVSFSNGKEFGLDHPCLVLRQLGADFKPIGTYMYEFKTESAYAIVNYDANTANYDKVHFESLEIEQLREVLRQYCMAATNAQAYFTVNEMKYSTNSLAGKINSLAEGLGVNITKSQGGYNNNRTPKPREVGGGSSSFNNAGSASPAQRSSLDDLEGEIGE